MPLGQPSREGPEVVEYVVGSSGERCELGTIRWGNMEVWVVMKALDSYSFIRCTFITPTMSGKYGDMKTNEARPGPTLSTGG